MGEWYQQWKRVVSKECPECNLLCQLRKGHTHTHTRVWLGNLAGHFSAVFLAIIQRQCYCVCLYGCMCVCVHLCHPSAASMCPACWTTHKLTLLVGYQMLNAWGPLYPSPFSLFLSLKILLPLSHAASRRWVDSFWEVSKNRMRGRREKKRRENERQWERKNDRERQTEAAHGVMQNEPAQIWRD